MAQDDFYKRLEQAKADEARRRADMDRRRAEDERRRADERRKKEDEIRQKKREELLAKRRKENDEYQKQFTQHMTTEEDNSPTSLYEQFSQRRHDFKGASEARYSSSYDPHSGERADVRLNRGFGADPIRKVNMNDQVNHRKYDGNSVRVHVRLQSGVGSNSKSSSSNTSSGVKLNRGW